VWQTFTKNLSQAGTGSFDCVRLTPLSAQEDRGEGIRSIFQTKKKQFKAPIIFGGFLSASQRCQSGLRCRAVTSQSLRTSEREWLDGLARG
jgi:hypothetical protein